jgi:exodeoxyribonuclease V alpha subunit
MLPPVPPPNKPEPTPAPPRVAPGVAQASLFGATPSKAGPGGSVSVEGEVVRVTYESEKTGWRVLRVAVTGKADPEAWVGVFQAAPPGTRVRATGQYVKDPKHGEQLKVESLITVAPSTLDGIERYLGSGMVPGIGPAYAKRIVEAFGEQTLAVLDRSPERLAEVPGLGPKRAELVTKAWEQHRAVSAIMIFLQQHDISPALAHRIYKRFGAQAIEKVSKSPYRLALEVWGVGFKTADRIARSMGIGPDAPERAQAGVYHVVHDQAEKGHVYTTRGELAYLAAEMLGRDVAPVEEATAALAQAGHVRMERLANGEEAVYPVPLHAAETRLAQRLAALLRYEGVGSAALAKSVDEAIAAFQKRTGVELAPSQREAVHLAAKHKVLVVTGGPGVGKTTIVQAMIALFDLARLPVRLAAPTGRAAKRMTEATRRQAQTLHRLLEFDPKQRAFARKLGRPIEASALIVDETSMLDLELADALVQATSDSARLVLVGDVDQLPSVGPGAVLRDVIGSGRVPTVRLTEIFRQAAGSLIVQNAHRIHDGIPPESTSSPDGEFYVIERDDATHAVDTILDVVTRRIPNRFGLDPRTDVQVLTPMHKGDAGASALNEKLQAALNPVGQSVSKGQKRLRVGDKVMQLRNNYDKDVFNGDVGFVSGIEEETRTLKVLYDEREVIYEEREIDELTLAYATSIHKSQGSEYPAVVVPLLTQHFVMLSRNLLYTAVTRGKKLVVLVAAPRAIKIALDETRREERRTYLAERLRSAAET